MPVADSTFTQYQKKLNGALESFEEFFQSQIDYFEPELKEVVAEVLRHHGKRLRPGFVFACAEITAKPSERALRMAAIVELIHLATLVHDDILDNAKTRHGAPAHHLLWNAKISVLTGDTLFLRANELAAMEDDVWVGRVVSAAAKATCSGEIAQGLALPKGALSQAAYERQLLLKTGKLFGLSYALGASLATADESSRARLTSCGENFGVAYQLYDDAVDLWGSEADYKKTLGSDQRQRKWTLPWILLAEEIGEAAMEPLWGDRAAALKAFEERDIFSSATEVFESFIAKAFSNIRGLPQEKTLAMPLEYLNEKWMGLGKQNAF